MNDGYLYRKVRNNIRRSARKKLPELFERFGGKCHFCQKDLVMVRDVRKIDPLCVVGKDTVKWMENGEIKEQLFATTEHPSGLLNIDKKPFRPEDLILSCYLCNVERGYGRSCKR